jgi:glucose-1-phosphate thymidylyltransferase
VQVLEHRQGVRIACLEEIAWRMGYIDRDTCYRIGSRLANSPYGRYIMDVTESG